MDNDYKDLLSNIKQKVNQAQLKTVVAANSQMLFLYWEMGNYIIQNQNHRGWGAKIISLLSADLRKEFPAIKGFSARNMLYMKQFAEAFPIPVLQLFVQLEKDVRDKGIIAQQLVAQLQSIENQHIEFVQQPVAQLEESLFMQSVLARLSWSLRNLRLKETSATRSSAAAGRAGAIWRRPAQMGRIALCNAG
jgi:uncharacterized protein DUF1016